MRKGNYLLLCLLLYSVRRNLYQWRHLGPHCLPLVCGVWCVVCGVCVCVYVCDCVCVTVCLVCRLSVISGSMELRSCVYEGYNP